MRNEQRPEKSEQVKLMEMCSVAQFLLLFFRRLPNPTWQCLKLVIDSLKSGMNAAVALHPDCCRRSSEIDLLTSLRTSLGIAS